MRAGDLELAVAIYLQRVLIPKNLPQLPNTFSFSARNSLLEVNGAPKIASARGKSTPPEVDFDLLLSL